MLPGLGNTLYDISAAFDHNAWYGAVLGGMFNITPAPTVLEAVVWVAYVVPTLTLYLRALHRRTHPQQSSAPAGARPVRDLRPSTRRAGAPAALLGRHARPAADRR